MEISDMCWLPSEQNAKHQKTITITVEESGSPYAYVYRELCEKYFTKLYQYVSITRKKTNKTDLLINAPEDMEAKISSTAQEGYKISSSNGLTSISSTSHNGVLYGIFRVIQGIQKGDSLENISIEDRPATSIRMLNHWDNIDGSVERGYAGKSIFFQNDEINYDYKAMIQYAELICSIGINAVCINNVNVHYIETKLITNEKLDQVSQLAEIFRKYGIALYLSVNYASPVTLEKLDTADPLNEDVIRWWENQTALVYKAIPDFGGFVVKADSENRPGPHTYGRTHEQGANMIAKALSPYGGKLFWRCFVYNHLQDWRDRSTDRAKAAYEHFMPLDGEFEHNVILQIKSGPMDFQVREPVSPLLGALKKTNNVVEFQITQEYTGQQIDLFYLPQQWREILDFDTFYFNEGAKIHQLLSKSSANNIYKGVTAVANIGRDKYWTGHKFAQANLFGYGLLAWDPVRDTDNILETWLELTFPELDFEAQKVIFEMLKESTEIYENYTAPLGVGWMINKEHHYGPSVNAYEYEPWGTYHFSDREGLGVDRTVNGSNFVNQYSESNKNTFNDIRKCPENLLLFFHHVPYTHKLSTGNTVIQEIYDTHFYGVERIEKILTTWNNHRSDFPEPLYDHVRRKLEKQISNAREWRDQVNTYYYRMSGFDDKYGRKIHE